MGTRASLLKAVGDDGILDAVVERCGNYALVFEVSFGAIRAEADDALGPDAGHSWDAEELVAGTVIDVDEF